MVMETGGETQLAVQRADDDDDPYMTPLRGLAAWAVY
jgi:hypothetical protein